MSFLSVLGFIALGIISRFIPHPANFTAINAIALFGVSSLGSLKKSLSILLAIMLLSDLVIGFHSTQLFVYLSYGAIALISYWVNLKKSLGFNLFLLIISSLLFFLLTNFGVWLVDPLYPKTLTGLGLCYLAAIPFLMSQFLGDCVYSVFIYYLSILAMQLKGEKDLNLQQHKV